MVVGVSSFDISHDLVHQLVLLNILIALSFELLHLVDDQDRKLLVLFVHHPHLLWLFLHHRLLLVQLQVISARSPLQQSVDLLLSDHLVQVFLEVFNLNVALHDVDFRGHRSMVYNLAIVPGPRVVTTLPMKVRRGAATSARA